MAKSELGTKLDGMSYYECLDYIRKNVFSVVSFLPKAYSKSFNELLDKLENDYKKCEAEKDEALAKLAEMQ